MSKVYFISTDAHEKKENNLLNKLERLYEAVDLKSNLIKNELVALKTHFGEEGATRYLRPMYLMKLSECIQKGGARPFLTDTNTFYVDHRHNTIEHLYTAMRHGFYPPTISIPIIIADGLVGWDYNEVKIKGDHFDIVKIGSTILHANALIAATHFKGHVVTGFGGAIKNIGMGCASRAAKLEIHGARALISDRCNGCGICIGKCPQKAIIKDENKGRPRVDRNICDSCGECSLHCYNDAIDPDWDGGSLYTREEVQERIAEYAIGAIMGKKGKVAYFNFLMDVTPECDCEPWADHPIVKDIGVLASIDLIAIDQASVDLVNAQEGIDGTLLESGFGKGEDKFKALNNVDWSAQLIHGEKIGLGTRNYELVEIS
jgi:uncharacterized Fe-S center protein